MKAINVKNPGLDLKVKEVKVIDSVKYYLLQDVTKDRPSNLPTFYQVTKESTIYREPFTGRMARFEDIEKTFKKSEYKARGQRGVVLEETEVPYIHNLNDHIDCNEKDAQAAFGSDYEMTLLRETDNQNNKTFCFYNKKEYSEKLAKIKSKESKKQLQKA